MKTSYEEDRTSPQTRAIAEVRKMIEEEQVLPTLHEMADKMGMSPFHFHRPFKKVVWVTPRQYAMNPRVKRARADLKKGQTVTEAVYSSGFAFISRSYEKSTAMVLELLGASHGSSLELPLGIRGTAVRHK